MAGVTEEIGRGVKSPGGARKRRWGNEGHRISLRRCYAE